MKLTPFSKASDFEKSSDYFKSTTTVAGQWVKGDQLKRVTVTNESATSVVPLYRWYNVSDGSEPTTVPVIGTDCIIWSGARVVVGSEILTVAATAVSLASIPSDANHAEIHVWVNDVIFNVDGVTPAPATFNGYRQSNGVSFELESRDEIDNFEAIQLVASSPSTLKVTYFCVGDDPNA